MVSFPIFVRLFLAIELSDAVRRALVELVERLKQSPPENAVLGKCSWVRAQNLHLTLKFFGEVAEPQVQGLCDVLAKVQSQAAICLNPSRIEPLPPRGPIRIIASAMEGQLSALRDLHSQIEQRCQELGFPAGGRQFRPHVTLARARRPLPPRTRPALDELAAGLLPGPQMMADEFVLMESRLDPQAAHYTPVARFPIG